MRVLDIRNVGAVGGPGQLMFGDTWWAASVAAEARGHFMATDRYMAAGKGNPARLAQQALGRLHHVDQLMSEFGDMFQLAVARDDFWAAKMYLDEIADRSEYLRSLPLWRVLWYRLVLAVRAPRSRKEAVG